MVQSRYSSQRKTSSVLFGYSRSIDPTLSSLLFFSIVGLILVLTVPHLDFVPFWDGGIYLSCLMQNFQVEFEFKNLACAKHPSYAYLFFLFLFQLIDPGNIYLVNGLNILLALAGFSLFYRLLQCIFPEEESRTEGVLAAALFGLNPVLLGSLFHLNLDFPLAILFVGLLLALVSGRFFVAAVVGILMIFTKDMGLFLYLGSSVLSTILHSFGSGSFRRERKSGLFRSLPLLLPIIAAGIFHLWLYLAGGETRIHTVASAVDPHIEYTLWPLIIGDGRQLALLSSLFVLNFAWIASAFILFALIRGAFLAVRNPENCRNFVAKGDRRLLFLVSLALFVLLILTRPLTFNNARYVLSALPLFIFCFYLSLRFLVQRHIHRFLILMICLALTMGSNIRTLDPVSKALFGTFQWGEHELLCLSSLGHDFCGGSDQVVYNLEYLRIHDLYNEAFARLRPDNAILVGTQASNFLFPGRVDRESFQRTARFGRGVLEIKHLSSRAAVTSWDSKSGERILYHDFPTFRDVHFEEFLRKRLPVKKESFFRQDGYELRIVEFFPKPKGEFSD